MTRKEIEAIFPFGKISRIIIIRTLNSLIDQGWVKQSGGGKYVRYSLAPGKELFVPIDSTEYFQTPADSRKVRYQSFNPDVLGKCSGLFSEAELKMFEEGKKKLRNCFSNVDPSIIKRELERFTIEFSWKSSQIEGNTYSLLFFLRCFRIFSRLPMETNAPCITYGFYTRMQFLFPEIDGHYPSKPNPIIPIIIRYTAIK